MTNIEEWVDKTPIGETSVHTPLFDKVKKSCLSNNVKLTFLIGRHGVGKTANLSSLFKNELEGKDYRVRIKEVDASKHDSVYALLFEMFSVRFKIFIFVFSMLVIYLLTRFSVSIIGNSLKDTFVIFTFLFSFLVFLNGNRKFYIFLKYLNIIRSIYYKIHDRLCKCKRIIWIDDIERSTLNYTETWYLFENLVCFNDNFLISIGYNRDEDKSDIYSQLLKLKDNLKFRNYGTNARIFFLPITSKVNYSVLFKYINKNLNRSYPFSVDENDCMDWIQIFSPREIEKICIEVDSYISRVVNSENNFLSSESDYDLAVYFLFFKYFFKDICSKNGILLVNLLNKVYFTLNFFSNRFYIGYSLEESDSLYNHSVFKYGIYKRLEDLSLSFLRLECVEGTYLETSNKRTYYSEKLVEEMSPRVLMNMNDFFEQDCCDKELSSILSKLRILKA